VEEPSRSLEDKFNGKWLVRKSGGTRFEGRSSSLQIVKVTHKRKQKSKSKAEVSDLLYTGILALGDSKFYLGAVRHAETSVMIGTSLKTTFTWRKPHEEGKNPIEGKLIVFFNGCEINGYLSEGDLKENIEFEGHEHREEQNTYANRASSGDWSSKFDLAGVRLVIRYADENGSAGLRDANGKERCIGGKTAHTGAIGNL
jgi:hypothetical protein